ncbi:MAG TPA: carboxylating nicotinate-nucleotide diphosphorylase [Blastocatellia bacterium]|nr:carboxylating nicotinate-nucleotide diphosphorylase [Blastocatellia bacterium]
MAISFMELDPGIIFSYASDLLKEDLGRGDITTQAVVRGGARGRGRFLAKQDFVLCGLELAEAVFASLDGGIQIESRVYDGEVIAKGTEFATVEGPASVLLSGERTALNLLQLMSGVATLTRTYVDKVAGTEARIVDTRKTTPGLRVLEKYAVTVGGGFNHRFGLDDGVLIKDNHIVLAGGVKRAIELARRAVPHLMKIEVEVSNITQLRDALSAGADVVLLDNMKPEEIRACVSLVRDEDNGTIIEVSGGVNLETVRELAECGPDLISVGALTHSAPSVDISMKITPL